MNTAPTPQPGVLAKVLRKRKGLTLEQLAEDVGLSKGHLSRYERGEKALSVSSLMRLARVLDTSVSALVGEIPQTDLVHLVRAEERPQPQTAPTSEGRYRYLPLSKPGRSPATAIVVQLSNRSVAAAASFHEGEEMLYVLAGSARIEFGARAMVIRQGDFVQFPGTEQHKLTGLEQGTEILIVVTDQA